VRNSFFAFPCTAGSGLAKKSRATLEEEFMKRAIALTLATICAAGACARGPQVGAAGDVAPATPVNRNVLPVGTTMTARFDQSISTSNREGDQFTATVVDPVYAQNGAVAIPAGAVLSGRVTGVHSGSVVGDQSVIRLDFDELRMNGRTYPFEGSISNVTVNQSNGRSSTAKDATVGAAAGAVLGAVLSGGELSKVLTGGLLGAAAGTVISMGNGGGGARAEIPSGSTVTVRATQAVQVR
jgi:hypothetical protein